jgi:Flp pilus assembly protein TadD
LKDFLDVPAEIAEEAQARLGEIQLRRRKYARARRHLVAALRHKPDNARYHFLLGQACREDDCGNLERAARHFRRSLELDANQVPCLLEYGLLAIRLGRSEEGLARLREASEQAPGDPDVTKKVVKGLRHLGRPDDARSELLAALFRNPRDPRFRRLWNDYRFREARRQQINGCEVNDGDDDVPMLLKFVRRDGAQELAGPFRTRREHREAK